MPIGDSTKSVILEAIKNSSDPGSLEVRGDDLYVKFDVINIKTSSSGFSVVYFFEGKRVISKEFTASFATGDNITLTDIEGSIKVNLV